MIYTITFNPSIDYVMEMEGFEKGIVNRSKGEFIECGGKGINVSIMLKNLGVNSRAMGFIAGFTGLEIENRMNHMGIDTEFITLDSGMSRINVKVQDKGNSIYNEKDMEETELNGIGPSISENDVSKLLRKMDRVQDGDMLVLAGSIPSSISDDIYMRIIQRVKDKNIHVIVDTSKDLLLNVLKYRPFLVKPNHHELGEIFGVELEDKEDIYKYAKKLQELGARNVLVSMASKGAILVTEDNKASDTSYMYLAAPKGKVVNSVGAGDSMVAGFIAEYMKLKDYDKAFRLSVAAGSASAFSKGIATCEKVEEILKKIN